MPTSVFITNFGWKYSKISTAITVFVGLGFFLVFFFIDIHS